MYPTILSFTQMGRLIVSSPPTFYSFTSFAEKPFPLWLSTRTTYMPAGRLAMLTVLPEGFSTLITSLSSISKTRTCFTLSCWAVKLMAKY